MRKTGAPIRPPIADQAAGGPTTCPDCSHARVGQPQFRWTRPEGRRFSLRGEARPDLDAPPTCPVPVPIGMGDEDFCGCENPAHRERVELGDWNAARLL